LYPNPTRRHDRVVRTGRIRAEGVTLLGRGVSRRLRADGRGGASRHDVSLRRRGPRLRPCRRPPAMRRAAQRRETRSSLGTFHAVSYRRPDGVDAVRAYVRGVRRRGPRRRGQSGQTASAWRCCTSRSPTATRRTSNCENFAATTAATSPCNTLRGCGGWSEAEHDPRVLPDYFPARPRKLLGFVHGRPVLSASLGPPSRRRFLCGASLSRPSGRGVLRAAGVGRGGAPAAKRGRTTLTNPRAGADLRWAG
jgi:hypothetical protein